MALVRVDNATGTIAAPISAGATSITLSLPWSGPTIGGSNYTRIVLDPPVLGTVSFFFEAIYCTVINGSATVTVTQRGAEGSSAQSHAAGAFWVCGPSAEDITTVVQSVSAGTNVTVTGTATAPIINASGGGGGGALSGLYFPETYGSVVTEAAPAILAAHAAAAAAGGGTVWFSAIYPTLTGVQNLTGDNVTWRGIGKFASGLRMTTPASAALVTNSLTAPPRYFAIEDMMLNAQATSNTNGAELKLIGCEAPRVSRVWFYRAGFAGLVLQNCTGYTVEGCLFQDLGTPQSEALNLSHQASNGTIRENRFHYVVSGVTANGGTLAQPIEKVRILNNYMDLGWYTTPAIASGSGGTVTYSATVLTDSGASFSGLLTNGTQMVRIMPVLATNSGGTVTYDQTTVTDSSAPFSTTTMLRGHLVRTASGRFGVISIVDSTTVLHVEEWLDNVTRDFVNPPANGDAYTVYGVDILTIGAFTSTTITVKSSPSGVIWDRNGNNVTPASGTLYEVLPVVGNYPIYWSGFCRDSLAQDIVLKRSFGDMIEYGGTANGSTRIDSINNWCIDGYDTGIYLQGPGFHKAIHNTVIHCGGVGIGVGSPSGFGDNIVALNVMQDSPCNGQTGNQVAANLYIGQGSRNKIIGNSMAKVSSVTALYGIQVDCSSGVTIDSNTYIGNTAHNHGTYDYYTHSGGGGTITNGLWSGNIGVMDAPTQAAAAGQVTVNLQTTSYTLLLSDAGDVVEMNAAGGVNVTVPPNSTAAFPIGTIIEVCQIGAGQVTLVAGAGVTIDNPSSLTTRTQFSTVGLRKRGTDEWVASGDLT